MAGTLVPSAAIVHLRPQRGDADASWPVARRGREGQVYLPYINSFDSSFTRNLPTISSLLAFARGVLVPGSIFCDNLDKKH